MTKKKAKPKSKAKKPNKPTIRVAASDLGHAVGEMMNLTEACVFFGGRASPIDRSTFYRGVRNGLFPKPVKIGQRIARWRVSDCEEALKRMQQTGATP